MVGSAMAQKRLRGGGEMCREGPAMHAAQALLGL